MSIEKLLPSKAVILYLLEMIDMKYIDLEKSYIAPSGTAFFKINTDKLTEPPLEVTNPRYILENTIFDLACNYKCALCCFANVECERKILPNNEDEYYIPYVVSPTVVSTTPTGGTFKLLGNACPCPTNNLTAIDGTAPAAPAALTT